jgi:sugar O-acyltransferase (sialic acid O-acetyltransferase NeuD family)
MSHIIIFGVGPFAEMAHYFFTHDSDHTVVAFTVDGEYVREPTFQGLPVVAFEEVESAYPPGDHGMFVAVGIRGVNARRADKVAEAEAKGYVLVSFLSSRAVVHPDFRLGPNTMIMEHAIFHPFVEIGRDTIVWSGTRIGFRTRIGDHCWIAVATFGESVTVGDYSFLGVNSTIAPCVNVGVSNIIGAGALILESTRDHAVYKGPSSTPSRVPSHRLRNFGR